MKAVGHQFPGDVDVLTDIELPKPTPGPRDLLVEVRAISINPVDTKIRRGGGPVSSTAGMNVLGWDAAGVVSAVGSEVQRFESGDAVYYAGSVDRPGANAEFHLVDERIVGKKPKSIGFAEAAALPLTTITAWELLFDRLRVPREKSGDDAILIIGGAGGVGSITTQLAACLTGLRIISTASRPETAAWCREMGAHHVIDHRQRLIEQVKILAPGGVKWVIALTRAEDYFDDIIECMAPQGALGLIENVSRPVDINKLKPKNISLHWEFMFGRARYQTDDMQEQGRLLDTVGTLVDAAKIRSTMRKNLGLINAANVRNAHMQVESGATIGKLILEGFENSTSIEEQSARL